MNDGASVLNTPQSQGIMAAQYVLGHTSVSFGCYIDLAGGLDATRFEKAWAITLDEYCQGTFAWSYAAHEYRWLDDPKLAALRTMRAQLRRPHDHSGPMIAVTSYRVDEQRWLFYLWCHHAVIDGMGAGAVARRAIELYRDFDSPKRFLDNAIAVDRAERGWVASQEAFGRAGLDAEALEALDPPLFFGDSYLAAPQAPIRRRISSDPATPSVRKRLGRRNDISTLIAFVGVLLSALRGESSVQVSLPVAGREPRDWSAPGTFSFTVPLTLAVLPERTITELRDDVTTCMKEKRYRLSRRPHGVRSSLGPNVNVIPKQPRGAMLGVDWTVDVVSTGPVDEIDFIATLDDAGLNVDLLFNSDTYAGGAADAIAAEFAKCWSSFTRLSADRSVREVTAGWRAALDALVPQLSAAARTSTYFARKPDEGLLAEICGVFARALSLDEVMPDQDLYDQGGSSMVAVVIATVLTKDLRAPIEPLDVVYNPSPRSIWKLLDVRHTSFEKSSGIHSTGQVVFDRASTQRLAGLVDRTFIDAESWVVAAFVGAIAEVWPEGSALLGSHPRSRTVELPDEVDLSFVTRVHKVLSEEGFNAKVGVRVRLEGGNSSFDADIVVAENGGRLVARLCCISPMTRADMAYTCQQGSESLRRLLDEASPLTGMAHGSKTEAGLI